MWEQWLKYYGPRLKAWVKHCRRLPTRAVNYNDPEDYAAIMEEVSESYDQYQAEMTVILSQMYQERVTGFEIDDNLAACMTSEGL
jgi:hypothetical protein